MYKLVSLVQREDVSVKMDLLEGFYDEQTEYTTQENELAVAFGIYRYQGKVEEDISMYGELKAFYITWNAFLNTTVDKIPVK